MNRLFTACAVVVVGTALASPFYAQTTSQPAPAEQVQQTDLTGQAIYDSSGHKIGTVVSMSTNAKGERVAVVSVEKFLGLGGKNTQMPVSSLSARMGGGFTTSLTAAEIKKLPAAPSITD